MSLLLHIETSCQACSVAVSENSRLLAFQCVETGYSHAAKITILIAEVFKAAGIKPGQLSAVSVSRGPGSYTGLRIGVSTAKGLCFALNIPLISVETLKIMAWAVIQNNPGNSLFCPMIDARRMEVYSALYNSCLETVRGIEAEIISEESFLPYLEKYKIFFFGNGVAKCRDLIRHPNAFFLDGIIPLAQNMVSLAFNQFIQSKFEDVAYFEPFYLKDFVATTPRKNPPGGL